MPFAVRNSRKVSLRSNVFSIFRSPKLTSHRTCTTSYKNMQRYIQARLTVLYATHFFRGPAPINCDYPKLGALANPVIRKLGGQAPLFPTWRENRRPGIWRTRARRTAPAGQTTSAYVRRSRCSPAPMRAAAKPSVPRRQRPYAYGAKRLCPPHRARTRTLQERRIPAARKHPPIARRAREKPRQLPGLICIPLEACGIEKRIRTCSSFRS
jgi:hypothetical protein